MGVRVRAMPNRVIDLSQFQSFQAINLLSDPGHDPAKLPITNCCQFHIVYTLADGKQARVILAMRVAAGFAATTALAEQARAALVAGANWTALAAFMPTTVSLFAVNLRDRRTLDQPLVPSTGAATPGTSASPALPSEVAIVCTLRTAKVGPGNRGRAYFPGFATNGIATGDIVAPALMTALTNWITNISTAMTAIGGTWGLAQPHRLAYVSPTTGTSFPERPSDTPILTNASFRDNHWDSQRRRGLK